MNIFFERASAALIVKAMETPYFHLKGYMNRYWLVPYIDTGTRTSGTDGTGPVSFWKRPLAWAMQRLGFSARIHHILRSDDDRAFHDHPFDYLTVVLRGGYWEVVPQFESGIYIGDTRTWYGPGSIIRKKANSWHILELPEGETAWTLFITGKRKQKWGYLVNPRGKVSYNEYLGIPESSAD